MLCLYDQTEHATLEDLLKHLRRLKIKQEIYFNEIAPQRDLCTGEVIPFKAPAERYLKTQFSHKNHLKRWIKENPIEGRKWAIDWLIGRKADKRLIYPPSQVELRSLMCPTIKYYDAVGGYSAICHELGYVIRYDGPLPASRPLDCPVVIDNREQKPLKLDGPTIAGTLTCGDYGLPVSYDKGIFIERKSLEDFVSSLSDRETRPGDSNLARITRELERATEMGAYIVMLVEKDINDALGFNKIGCVPLKHCRVTPEHIFKNLRDLLVKFPLNFQVLFVAGRVEAKNAVPRLLAMGEDVKRIDLQAAYEKKELTFE